MPCNFGFTAPNTLCLEAERHPDVQNDLCYSAYKLCAAAYTNASNYTHCAAHVGMYLRNSQASAKGQCKLPKT